MKKLLFAAMMSSLLVCALAFSSAPLNKTHKGKAKDGVKINCTYCHKTAEIPKKGKDFKKHQKTKNCLGSDCHK